MKIVDSHAHVGDCSIFSHYLSSEEILEAMKLNSVTTSLVLPFPGAKDEPKIHDTIHEMSCAKGKEIFGIISLNPNKDDAIYKKEVKRCFDMGFVGLKLHPFGHGCPIQSANADKVFEAAREFDLPVIIHTGVGAPFTLPSLILPRARQYPEVKFIVGHGGTYFYASEAIIVAQEAANVYLETSWCPPHKIKEMVGTLGAERIMFGSDIPINIAVELTKYRVIGLTERELNYCLWETATRVFKLTLD